MTFRQGIRDSLVGAVAALIAAVLLTVAIPVPSRAQAPPATAPTTAPATTHPTTQPTDEAVAKEVRELLKALSSDDWQARKRAEESLVATGAGAEAALREFVKGTEDDEARTRAESALRRIAENRVSGPSFVTLHLKDAAPRDAFADLSRQANAELKPYPDNLWDQVPPATKVTVDVDRVPFWDAMRELSRQTGVDLLQFNDGMRLMQGGGGGQAQGPAVVRGAFLVVATYANRSQFVQYGVGPDGRPTERNRSGDFNIQFVVYPEPKLTVVGCNGQAAVKEAVDDRGNKLAQPGPKHGGYFGGGGMGVWNLNARLRYPEKPGTVIKQLRGGATFVVQTASQTIEVDNPLAMKDQARDVGGVPVVLRECARNGAQFVVKLTIARDATRAGGGQAWVQLQQTMQTSLRLLDAEGQPLDRQGFSGGGGDASGIQYELHFSQSHRPDDGRASGDPVKLVWTVPTETKEVPVEFEFNDLPMP